MISGLLTRWRTRRAISKGKRHLAALLREYDRICSEPGRTSMFTASRMHDLGYQIAMQRHALRTLEMRRET